MATLDQCGTDVAHQGVPCKFYNDIQMSDHARDHFGDIYGMIHFADSETQTKMQQQGTETRSSTSPLPPMRHSMHTTDNMTHVTFLGSGSIFLRRCILGLTVMIGRAVYSGRTAGRALENWQSLAQWRALPY